MEGMSPQSLERVGCVSTSFQGHQLIIWWLDDMVFKSPSLPEDLYFYASSSSLSSGTTQEINEGGEYCSSRGDMLGLHDLSCLPFLCGISSLTYTEHVQSANLR
jgi:hypothetical protein